LSVAHITATFRLVKWSRFGRQHEKMSEAPQRLRFSIITCTWNSAATLAETIESVQAQDYPYVEHIFVDGGSTDGTLDLIASRCSGAAILQDVKGGISRAMNAGIDAATGDVVAHLHSDDYYARSDVLTKVAEAFQRFPDRVWVYGKKRTLKNGELLPEPAASKPFTFRRYAAGSTTVPHPAAFIRRAVFATVGNFDPGLKYAMDQDLWLRLGQKHLPVQLDLPLTVFREHPGSLSSANKLEAMREMWKVRRRYFMLTPLETAIFGLRYLRKTRLIRRELREQPFVRSQ
jgi:glycosyltransferase involved in cell wall biosynthesis